MRAQSRFGFAGDTVTSIFPMTPVGRPPSSFDQLSPPSVDFQIPPSSLPEMIAHGLRSTDHPEA